MASKGQKFIKYTDEFINEIVDQMNKGVTAYHLTKVNNISLYTFEREPEKGNNSLEGVLTNQS